MTVYNTDEGYVYRWVQDRHENGSRIMKFIRGGYEFARSESAAGEYVIGQEAVYHRDDGTSIVRLPTNRDGSHAYLMRIKKEWYDEDQAAKEEAIREVERTIETTGTSDGDDFGQYMTSEKIKLTPRRS